MKFKLLVFVLIVLLVNIHETDAQGTFTVKGVVTDTAGLSLGNIPVILISEKDTFRTLTREDGIFEFVSINFRSFRVIIKENGYSGYNQSFPIPPTANTFHLGNISLTPQSHILEKVIVSAARRPIVIRGDTLEFNAGSFPVRVAADLEDLLRKLPGVEIDLEGNITLDGKPLGTFLVDGKPFFGSQGLKLALPNLPASIIDKVQVIDDYGDRAKLTGIKTEDSKKILNIVIKEESRHGRFGNATAKVGTKGKYQGGLDGHEFRGEKEMSFIGNVNNISQAAGASNFSVLPTPGQSNIWGTNMTYANRLGKWLPSGNYSINHSINTRTSSILSETYFANGSNIAQSNNASFVTDQKQQVEVKLDHSTATEHVTENFSWSMDKNRSTNIGTFSNFQQDSSFRKTSTGNTSQLSDNNMHSASTRLNYDKSYLSSKRRWSLAANFSYSTNLQTSDNLINSLITLDSASIKAISRYSQTSTQYHADFGMELHYYEPLGRKSFLELSYSYQEDLIHNSLITRSPDSISGISRVVDSLSSKFITGTINQKIQGGWLCSISRFDISANIAVLPITLNSQDVQKIRSLRYSSINWTPNIQVAYTLTPRQKVFLTLSGNSKAPEPGQLLPVTNIVNPEYPVVGNPNLKPSLTQVVNLRYNFITGLSNNNLNRYNPYNFSIGLNFFTTQNIVIANLLHPHNNSSVIQETLYENANGFYAEGIQFSGSLPRLFHRRLNISIIGELNNVHAPSMVDSVAYTVHNLNATWHLNVSYQPSKIFDLAFNTTYTSSAISYAIGQGMPGNSGNLIFSMGGGLYLWNKWRVGGAYLQSTVKTINQRFQTYPAMLSSYVSREFLKGHRAKIILSGTDLLNSNTGVSQTATPNSISQVQTSSIGRYFMLSFQLKFSHFGK